MTGVLRRTLPAAVAAVLILPALAAAHTERPSYWPDPAPDTAVSPAAGGGQPALRSLDSSLRRHRGVKTRVVCQPDSMERLNRSIAAARRGGFENRPTDRRPLTRRAARQLRQINRSLKRRCKFSEIQPAVTASNNNDRVVIMPGLYTEPTARAAPTHDPACDQYEVKTEFGDPGALGYDYQWHCPNDQNLIAVMGRRPGTGEEPDPPNWDRRGIPNLGPCVRCNIQMEGSGVSADDVVIDAGRVESGNKGPHDAKKDVVVRADRADGFVLRNVTVRHAREHGIYVLETDGYVLDRFKAFYNGLYGTLTFVSDHGLQQNCEAVGHGDSGIYPGGAPETGVQRAPETEQRLNQEIRFCDLHHNLAGYSGTNGNGIWVHHNEVFDNTLGLQTDVVTAAGHPGYPGDSALFENNNIYANNFNPYAPESDVKASFPFPIGTGMWIAGGNHHTIRNNRIFDNWRRGAMLFTVPDALICGPVVTDNEQAGCEGTNFTTSHYNSYYDNVMGEAPGGAVLPNGTDFWFDSYPGSRGNCWYRNSGPHAITTSPPSLPDCDDGKDPASSIGTSYPPNEGELVGCLVSYETDSYDPTFCPWFDTPAKPGTARAASSEDVARNERALEELADLRRSSPRSLTSLGILTAPASTQTSTPLSQFDCADWRRADFETRRGIVRRLTFYNGGRVGGTDVFGWGVVLPPESAFGLFDGRCAARGSSGMTLYKLYGYAAGFAGVGPPAQLLR